MAKNTYDYLDYIKTDKLDYIIENNKDINKIYNDYSLNNIINDYNIIKKPNSNNLYSNRIQTSILQSGINWGTQRTANTQNAYVQPTPEEVGKVLEALHRVQGLPLDQQKQLVEATREIRYFFDGQVRARFGATNHFNAIRCLNNPEATQVETVLDAPRTQLAGEEFFALNRFMQNFPDIADIQWWSVYKNGSWGLDTWNPEGEHLDTGVNGWGDLVGSVMKLNGRVLTPQEMIAFHRTVKLRNERGFMRPPAFVNLQAMIRILDTDGSLPRRYDEQIETAHDLGLVDVNGKSLTYAGQSMISQVTARQRKARQLAVTNDQTRRIIVPTIFN